MTKKILLALLLSVLTLSAADLTGKWSGNIEFQNDQGEVRKDTAYAVLKQNGNDLSGSAGPGADHQFPFEKGTIDGKKIKFDVPLEGGTMKFDLSVVGDGQLEGQMMGQGPNGEKMTARLTLKREG